MLDAAPTEEDHAPICPACGVTKLLSEDAEAQFVCAECGFTDDDD